VSTQEQSLALQLDALRQGDRIILKRPPPL
jgi:hypothetical protein